MISFNGILNMNENATSLVELLKRVEQIRLKHELAAKLTGENFNVFEILGLNTCEVRTHSAFIAELLDPSGVHGQGDTFLRLFSELDSTEFSSVTRGWKRGRKALDFRSFF